MRRSMTIAVAAVLLAVSACAPKVALQQWPRAESERTYDGPAEDLKWPLTGKPALDASAAASPAVLLPIADAAVGGPLPGIESADVTYEFSGATAGRITALFQSSLPAAAGPLRPADALDRALARLYRTALIARASGSGSLADVATLASRVSTASSTPPFGSFSGEATVSASLTVKRLSVPVGVATVDWRYDSARASYVRYVGGKPQFGTRASQVRVANVVVMWARSTDASSAPLDAGGRASVFSLGRQAPGTWEASGTPPAFRDESGMPIRLVPGSTWIEVIPSAANILVR